MTTLRIKEFPGPLWAPVPPPGRQGSSALWGPVAHGVGGQGGARAPPSPSFLCLPFCQQPTPTLIPPPCASSATDGVQLSGQMKLSHACLLPQNMALGSPSPGPTPASRQAQGSCLLSCPLGPFLPPGVINAEQMTPPSEAGTLLPFEFSQIRSLSTPDRCPLLPLGLGDTQGRPRAQEPFPGVWCHQFRKVGIDSAGPHLSSPPAPQSVSLKEGRGSAPSWAWGTLPHSASCHRLAVGKPRELPASESASWYPHSFPLPEPRPPQHPGFVLVPDPAPPHPSAPVRWPCTLSQAPGRAGGWGFTVRSPEPPSREAGTEGGAPDTPLHSPPPAPGWDPGR